MSLRAFALLLLGIALAIIIAPAVLAMLALVRGDFDEAREVFGPVLLIPIGFMVLGIVWSFRRKEVGPGRKPLDD